ncbi:MAG: hypothetical protein KBT00_00255 [Bacteroidales bacterium]|nr:hypothetical protein [Candidatus Cacconaster merdequi]
MKLLKYIEYALLIISLIVFVIGLTTISTESSPALNIYLVWTYILVAAALIFTIGFPLVKAFSDKKSLKKLIILVVAAIVVFGGIYLIAPGKAIDVNTVVSEGTFKFADAALYICYLFVGASVVALIWSAAHKAIK